jgi:LPS sulfotransferase NodH
MAADGPATIPIRHARRPLKLAQLGLEWQRLRHQAQLHFQWWRQPHTPYQPVFVLASHRSGSNLLIDYLNRMPGVESHSEILCRVFANGPASYQVGARRTLGHIRRSLHTLRSATRGCKLMLDQLAASRLPLDALHAAFPEAKYIVLYRQSLAEQFVSKQTAFATNQWTLCKDHERKHARVRVNPTALRTYCEKMRQSYREALGHAWLPERALVLSYEELTAHPRRWLREEICPLLGVPPSEPQTLLLKQSTLPLAERVENYSEVAALLASPLCQQRYSWPDRRETHRRAA